MGAAESKGEGHPAAGTPCPAIHKRHEDAKCIRRELQDSGFEGCELVVGVDFTKSNDWKGEKSFGGKALHSVEKGVLNPYLVTLKLIAETLPEFDDDKLINCYGFGDTESKDTSVFPFFPKKDDRANGFASMLARYEQIAPEVNLSGPTTFAPLIQQTMRIVYEAGMRFHILLILADGQITGEHEKATADAIVDASFFPISIVMIGVGDGPWDGMSRFDDKLRKRKWDNFQFVEFTAVVNGGGPLKIANFEEITGKQKEKFCSEALAELPDQYNFTKKHALLGPEAKTRVKRIIDRIPANVLGSTPANLPLPLPLDAEEITGILQVREMGQPSDPGVTNAAEDDNVDETGDHEKPDENKTFDKDDEHNPVGDVERTFAGDALPGP